MLQNITFQSNLRLKIRLLSNTLKYVKFNKQMSNYIKFDNQSKSSKEHQKSFFILNSTFSNELLISSVEIKNHLRWIATKYLLNQDIFLIGSSSSLRRKLAYLFCNIIESETELLVITRDTVESDLRQRKEIIHNGKSTMYSDSPVVKAAIYGRILILDGIEKAERNVLPTLNNLLENREMSLDDGRYLLPAHKYDALVNELGFEECHRRGLERVSEHFKVFALGLPIPPYIGHALDPPLRSRFQARVIETPSSFSNIDINNLDLINAINQQLQSFTDLTKGDIPRIPYDSLLRLKNIISQRVHKVATGEHLKINKMELLDIQTIRRYYPYHFYSDEEVSKQVETAFKHIGIHSKQNVIATNNNINDIRHSNYFSPNDKSYVETPSIKETMQTISEDWSLGHDICIIGEAGSGKSAFVNHFLKSKLNIDPTADTIESIFLYQDMSARDLIEQRVTDLHGNTIWQPSPVVKAAKEGKILILDGIDRLSIDALCILAPLIQDRRLPIHGSNILLTSSSHAESMITTKEVFNTKINSMFEDLKRFKNISKIIQNPMEIIEIHPNFRIIALASPPTVNSPWMGEEISSLFAFHRIQIDDQHLILETLFPKEKFITKLLEYSKSFQKVGTLFPSLSLRRMLRISRQLVSSKEYSLEQVIHQQLLLDMFPESDKELLPLNFRNELKLSNVSIQSYLTNNDQIVIPSIPSMNSLNTDILDITEDIVRIGSISVPRYELKKNPELIPNVTFSPMKDHLIFLKKIMNSLFNAKEKHVLIIGSQGVGKNRIIDGFLQMLRAERYYMQLHRDSTVGSLSVTPELDNGMIIWKDSPLVKAAIEGKWIILDEVDKAPLEVVILLKSLLADGILPLSDGRKLGSKLLPIHPEFRSFVLANRPGFPFLGNDFFRSCGDIFSSFILNNPNTESELVLLQKEAPNVSISILQRLASLFADLRLLSLKGILPYPFSMRELLHVVRHVNKFGQVDEALKSIFAFDTWNVTALKHIKNTLQIHEFPIDTIFFDNYLDQNDIDMLINIQKPEILPNPIIVGTRSDFVINTYPNANKISFSKWQIIRSENIALNPSVSTAYNNFEYIRTKQFSEIVLAFKLNLVKNSIVSSIATTNIESNNKIEDEICITTEQSDNIQIYQINTSNWECRKRVLDIYPKPSTHPRYNMFGINNKNNIERYVAINGSMIKSFNTRCVYDKYKQCHIWIPFHNILISLPNNGSKDKESIDHEGNIINFTNYFNQNSIEKGSVQLVGCTHEGDLIFCSLSTGEIIQLNKSIQKDYKQQAYENKIRILPPSAIIQPKTSSAIQSIFIDNNKVGVVYEYNSAHLLSIDLNTSEDVNILRHMVQVNAIDKKLDTILQLQPSTQSGINTITMQAIDSSTSYALLYDPCTNKLQKLERKTILSSNNVSPMVSLAATTGSYTINSSSSLMNSSTSKASNHKESYGIEEGGGGGGWVINCKNDEIELIDTVLPATKRVIKAKYCDINSEPIAIVSIPMKRATQGSKVAIAYTNGIINIIEPSISSLETSLREYKDIRGVLDSDPNTHKHASGNPKHGKEDNEEHHGGNTWAGGTGGADTAGLGGVGGPYRLDKGFKVHQVNESLKQNLSPEAKAAARAMAKEALARRLEQIGMSSSEWNKYIELKTHVQDEINSLKQVLSNMKSHHTERIWKTSTEGELDGNRIIDALAGEKMVYRKRVLKEPKIGEKQILPKRISILLDVSASMYRFDNVDGRLQRISEVALMIMESFAEASSSSDQGNMKYDYELRGHAGDDANIIFIKWGEPPKNEKERYQIIQKIITYAQYCEAGDTTLQAVKYACDSVALAGHADERLVLAFSDANLDRYGITSKQLNDVLTYRQPTDKINTHIVFIASFGDQAIKLVNGVIPGHATVATDLKKLPHIIKEFMIATIAH